MVVVILKKIIAVCLLGCSCLGLFSCGIENNNTEFNVVAGEEKKPIDITNNKDNALDEGIATSLSILSNAKEIIVSRDIISLNNAYSISVDGVDFGSVSGKYINITGDKFTLKDNDGNELSSEKQIKRWNVKLNRLAEVYDCQGNVVGYIGEEVVQDLFNYGYTFHFYDKDKKEIGKSKQKIISLLDKFEIYDVNDNLCYEVNSPLP